METERERIAETIGDSARQTSNMVENIRKFTPIEGTYDFPIREVPVYADLSDGEFDTETLGSDNLVRTDMKSIVRTDTNKIISCVSNKYQVVKHADVINTFEKNLESDYDFNKKILTSHDGARVYAEYNIKGFDTDVEDGDPVSLRLIGRNSYDTSSSYGMSVEGLRLICLNGMMGFGTLCNFKKKHTGDIMIDADVKRNIATAISMYKTSLIPHWQNLSQNRLSKDGGIDIIRDISEKAIVPKKYEEDVIREWETKVNTFNAWLLYNCYTFILTHLIKKKSYENYINLSRKVGSHFRSRFPGQ